MFAALSAQLVGGLLSHPSEKSWSSSLGMMKFPIDGKIKNVPNHQPANYRTEAGNKRSKTDRATGTTCESFLNCATNDCVTPPPPHKGKQSPGPILWIGFWQPVREMLLQQEIGSWTPFPLEFCQSLAGSSAADVPHRSQYERGVTPLASSAAAHCIRKDRQTLSDFLLWPLLVVVHTEVDVSLSKPCWCSYLPNFANKKGPLHVEWVITCGWRRQDVEDRQDVVLLGSKLAFCSACSNDSNRFKSNPTTQARHRSLICKACPWVAGPKRWTAWPWNCDSNRPPRFTIDRTWKSQGCKIFVLGWFELKKRICWGKNVLVCRKRICFFALGARCDLKRWLW